jgi:hypothetical protein
MTVRFSALHAGRAVHSRYFRNKKREYLKDGMNELATNIKNKDVRDLYRRGVN